MRSEQIPGGHGWSGLAGAARFSFGLTGHGSPASVSVCPVAGPGVMMALEISPAQCRGCPGGVLRCSLVELRFVKVVGLSICGTTPRCGSGGFGGE